jgi:4-hydroxy 2-oxovalerate aldolase
MVPRMPFTDRSAPPSCRATPAYTAASSTTSNAPPNAKALPTHQILQRVGEAGYVGGQEDMSIDIAIQLDQRRGGVPA